MGPEAAPQTDSLLVGSEALETVEQIEVDVVVALFAGREHALDTEHVPVCMREPSGRGLCPGGALGNKCLLIFKAITRRKADPTSSTDHGFRGRGLERRAQGHNMFLAEDGLDMTMTFGNNISLVEKALFLSVKNNYFKAFMCRKNASARGRQRI